ncbi:CoA-transferase [Cupriavidus metallidurans]|uniref:CoA-transferase n=1 Tax=Cupriavidus TaxID=106589 RepID=UPI000E90C775|nr:MULTISPECIES: CoA-transferase [unclassified Cupriavidus]GMG93432.1 3-oxoadipate CoA-transferase subunit B [Cupriavidus sp. TKC]HBD35406.1 3-oxoadipate CoA-transferase [Cupriavidus sp.]HBO82666.1 3-oxoadipate CoA-transferase [Cupriavidus sp.]
MRCLTRNDIARLVAEDFPRYAVVNLGIGMPTMVTEHISPRLGIHLHSENGILGMAQRNPSVPPDPDLINASKENVALQPGASICDHALSFTMMRGGHLDITVLGAFEVAANGDIANWALGEGDPLPSVGGAMDLAVGTPTVWVMMETLTRSNASRLVARCELPLTAQGVVNRVYTEIGVFDVADGSFVPRALVEGVSPETIGQWVAGPLRWRDEPFVVLSSGTSDHPTR